MRTNFEPERSFANELDYQRQLDGWCEKVNARVHRTTRAVVAERLAEERQRMRPLPTRMPDADRRFVIRVAAQPYLRVDTNDYSLDPRLAGRRVEVRVSQSEITAVALDTAEFACRHRRRCARHLTFTDPRLTPGSPVGLTPGRPAGLAAGTGAFMGGRPSAGAPRQPGQGAAGRRARRPQ
jgi:hypothetical protein